MNKRILCMLLSLLSVGSAAMTACGDTNTVSAETQPKEQNSPQTEAVVTEDVNKPLDSVPELDFGGAEYRVSVTDRYGYEFQAESETGEITNDAVFRRNRMLEDRFNVHITPVVTVMNNNNEAQPNYVKKSILAGDDVFDTAALFVYLAGNLVLQGCFQNWYDIPYTDLSQPWWAHDVNSAFSVNGKLYTAVNDTCITAFQLAYVFLFNKQLAANMLDDDLYDIVETGKWTIDYLYNTSKDIYKDLNGDGKADQEDLYGFLGDNVTGCDAYFPAFDLKIVKETDGGFEYLLNNPKAVGAFEKLYRLYYENPGALIIDAGIYDEKQTIFSNSQALFAQMRMITLFNDLRDMDVDFGILPYPKLDESQESYHSNALDNYSVLCIPKTAQNLEMIGAVSEAMAAESRKSVVPAFYDIALKTKYTRDERSIKMLDYIMDGKNYDISTLYSSGFNRAYYFVRDLLAAKKSEYASNYEKKEAKFISSAEKLYSTLADLD
ncbi:MAG: hypothetical protein MJ175_08390 [Clostridia bacterium]|nr:hypothetical protein [Clostridia bacterium]